MNFHCVEANGQMMTAGQQQRLSLSCMEIYLRSVFLLTLAGPFREIPHPLRKAPCQETQGVHSNGEGLEAPSHQREHSRSLTVEEVSGLLCLPTQNVVLLVKVTLNILYFPYSCESKGGEFCSVFVCLFS